MNSPDKNLQKEINRIKFTITVCDDIIKVFDTSHAIERFFERLITDDMTEKDIKQAEWGIYSMLVSLGPNILDAKNGEIFGIYDAPTQVGLICQLTNEFNDNMPEIHLDIITVCKTKKFFVRQGQRIFDVDQMLKSEDQ